MRGLLPILAGLAGIVLVFIVMEHVFLARTPSGAGGRPLRRIAIASGAVCPGALRLPAWVHEAGVLKMAMAEEGSPYSGWEYVGSHFHVEYTWVQDGWTVDVGGFRGTPAPADVLAALLHHQLPGVGVLAWQYRQAIWVLTAAWQEHRACYDFHADVTPAEAPVITRVLVAWRQRPARLYDCRTRDDHLICTAMR
jgi:hypothetical protein